MPGQGVPFPKKNKLGGKRPGAGRKPRDIAELHEKCFSNERAIEAADYLLNVVKGRTYADTNRIVAAKYICDRVFGRTVERHDITIDAVSEIRIIEVREGAMVQPPPALPAAQV